jgi:hypothetical protein
MISDDEAAPFISMYSAAASSDSERACPNFSRTFPELSRTWSSGLSAKASLRWKMKQVRQVLDYEIPRANWDIQYILDKDGKY